MYVLYICTVCIPVRPLLVYRSSRGQKKCSFHITVSASEARPFKKFSTKRNFFIFFNFLFFSLLPSILIYFIYLFIYFFRYGSINISYFSITNKIVRVKNYVSYIMHTIDTNDSRRFGNPDPVSYR